MPISIRPATPADYAAMVSVENTLYPDLISTVEDLQHEEAQRPAHCKSRRWVVEQDGAIIALAYYTQYEGRYHPRKFVTSVAVHPDHQSQGIGSRLYELLRHEVAEHDPIQLRTKVRESLPGSIRFVENRGFTESMRTWESELELEAFDPAPWLEAVDRAAPHGVVIRSLQELASDPDRNHRLYDLVSAVRQDIPSPDPATIVSFDNFIRGVFSDPSLLPEGYLVAVAADGEYVGLTNLWKDSGDGILWTGLTGVRRAYRGRSIAQALKAKGLLWAKEQGKKGVRTFNASNNAPMLHINTQMGFVRKPAWIDYELRLASE